MNIPANVNKDSLYKYDPKNEYYNDGYNESGTDILLNGKHNEFNNNNFSLCEKNYTYNEYNNDNKKARCECGIKNEQIVISELVNKNILLSYEFYSKNDMIILNCNKTIFTKDGLPC